MADALPDYLQQAYDQTAAVRDRGGFQYWNDAWSNFVVNQALSEYEFAHNKEMWDLMNEYNSPAEQMKRYKEAGLNPMLIYSQGSNGNAGSQAQYSKPNIQFTPNEARNKNLNARLDAALQVVGTIQSLVDNIGSMIGSGYDLQLKRNQVMQSNFDLFAQNATYGTQWNGLTPVMYRSGPGNFDETLNPLSERFDPVKYMTFYKNGQLPQFWNTYQSSESQRELLNFRSRYQEYYNNNLLTLFKDFQEGKIDLQDWEKKFQQYNYEVTEMMPPWLRGVLDPLVQYISPFLKFIFKRSTGNFNVNRTLQKTP